MEINKATRNFVFGYSINIHVRNNRNFLTGQQHKIHKRRNKMGIIFSLTHTHTQQFTTYNNITFEGHNTTTTTLKLKWNFIKENVK